MELQCLLGGKSGLTVLFGAENCFRNLAGGEMLIQGPLGAQFPATPSVGTDVMLGPLIPRSLVPRSSFGRSGRIY